MKVKLKDIFNSEDCGDMRAAERLMHMRLDDAYSVVFILRRLLAEAYYDDKTSVISLEGDTKVKFINYNDIITLSKITNRKPYRHCVEHAIKINKRVFELKNQKEV